ncbi:hypothetical protein KFU94_60945 [Chloroflexi bacterium TSY]|nr:hypothetical protein [Chloroflexi bacterium TSY]
MNQQQPSSDFQSEPSNPASGSSQTAGSNTPQQDQSSFATAPAIQLPTGGGAIRGIDEKFQVNPATGSGSMTIPIATSPARNDFGPQLVLTYDSNGGNGPFGLGWALSIPNITRKTDKGLPRYRDGEESDIFILSGAEDLVPQLEENGGDWTRHRIERTVDGIDYQIERY